MSFPKQEIESLWCPWRVEYYEAEHRTGEPFLAAAASATDDRTHLVVARQGSCFLMMNKYPYAVGHLMVVPNREAAWMEDLSPEEVADLWALAVRGQQLLRSVVRAQGFNVGLNLGAAGGAGFAAHLHLHIVPRWPGDSNFMPVIGQTRILPQALEPLYDRLVVAHQNLPPERRP